MRLAALALAAAVAFTAPSVLAGASGFPAYSARYSAVSSHSATAPGVHRDSHGKIARDPRQTNAFKKQHPCPSTGKTSGSCPGYVIDHIKPLKRGGADIPSNMQWQTEGAAMQKDRWE